MGSCAILLVSGRLGRWLVHWSPIPLPHGHRAPHRGGPRAGAAPGPPAWRAGDDGVGGV